MNVGFIGLGSMGLPLAQRLLNAGHALTVYNRTASRAQPLEPLGARIAATPAAAAAGAEALVTMLADDDALEAVLLGEAGALGTLPRGAIHVSMSTISPALSRWCDERHRTAGQLFVAAPVFGRPDAVAAGKVWIVAAGPVQAIERCHPLFDAMGQGVIPVGEVPARANVIKVAGNLVLAAVLEALGEAFTLAQRHGVAPALLLEIINDRVIRSPVYESYGKAIAAQRYEPAGFKLRLGLKDMRLVLDSADEKAVPLPLASLVRDRFVSAVARGWGDMDWAALARVAAADAGL